MSNRRRAGVRLIPPTTGPHEPEQDNVAVIATHAAYNLENRLVSCRVLSSTGQGDSYADHPIVTVTTAAYLKCRTGALGRRAPKIISAKEVNELSNPKDTTILRLMRMSSLLEPWVVRVAATLRLPDLVAGGAGTAAALAQRSGADADALARLMRHLTILGFFSITAAGTWEITELGALLKDDHPLGMRRGLDQNDHYAQKLDRSVHGLLDAVRAGDAVWEIVHGLSFWDNMTADPQLAESFNAHMAHHSSLFGPAISRGYDWSHIRRIVDVGGGTGRTLATLLSAHPHLHGTLIDQPGPIADATAVLTEAGVIDRCTVLPQSFFDPLPAGGDVYLLANIIHDWNDDDSIKVLSRCVQAAGPAGRILLAERTITDQKDHREQLSFSQMDLYMLLLFGSRERTLLEFHELAAAAGLQHTTVYALADFPTLSLIEYTVAHLGPDLKLTEQRT